MIDRTGGFRNVLRCVGGRVPPFISFGALWTESHSVDSFRSHKLCATCIAVENHLLLEFAASRDRF